MIHSTVPFAMKVSRYSKLEGMLHAQSDGLRIEFYHKETVFNFFGSRLREKPVSLDELRSITHKKGWFRDTISIRFRTLEAAEGIPGTKTGELRVKTKKSERARAEALVVDLNLAMADKRLADLESRRN